MFLNKELKKIGFKFIKHEFIEGRFRYKTRYLLFEKDGIFVGYSQNLYTLLRFSDNTPKKVGIAASLKNNENIIKIINLCKLLDECNYYNRYKNFTELHTSKFQPSFITTFRHFRHIIFEDLYPIPIGI